MHNSSAIYDILNKKTIKYLEFFNKRQKGVISKSTLVFENEIKDDEYKKSNFSKTMMQIYVDEKVIENYSV